MKEVNKFDPKLMKEIQDLFKKMHSSISLLYDLATHDEKTGLYNNRFFENQLDFEIENFNEFHKIMLDIRDKFPDIIKHYDFAIIMNEDKLDYYPGAYPKL